MDDPDGLLLQSDTADVRRTRPVHIATVPNPSEAVEVALLDRSGVIVAVNGAWAAFSAANGGDPAGTGVGVSYLQVCSEVPHDPFARRVASAVRTALGGGLPAPVQVEVPCHAPDASRWFDVLVSSRFDDAGACMGATVTFSPVAQEPTMRGPVADGVHGPAEPVFYADRSERLTDAFAQLVLERAPLAIVVLDDHGTVVRAGRAAEQLFGHGPDGLTGGSVRRLLPDLDPSRLLDQPALPSPDHSGPVLVTDAVLADGSAEPVEVRVGRLPLSRGTGALLLVRRASPDVATAHPDHVVFRDEEIEEVMRALDDVVRHVFNSGLTLTGAAAARLSDQALSTTLVGITEDLDRATREIRSIGHLLGHFGRRTPYVRSTDPSDPGT